MTPADLRAIRGRLGLSQQAMAREMGMRLRQYGAMERGEREAPIGKRHENAIAGVLARLEKLPAE